MRQFIRYRNFVYWFVLVLLLVAPTTAAFARPGGKGLLERFPNGTLAAAALKAEAAAPAQTLGNTTNTLLRANFGNHFLQLLNYNTNPFVFTIDRTGKFTVAFYVNSTIGYVNPRTRELLYCDYFSPQGHDELELDPIDCYATSRLDDISPTAAYSNGTYIRSGNDIRYEDGSTFYSGYYQNFYHSNGNTFFSNYYQSYYWPSGNTLYSNYYQSAYYNDGDTAYSNYYKSLYYESSGNRFYSDYYKKFYYDNGYALSGAVGTGYLDLYYPSQYLVADYVDGQNLMNIFYANTNLLKHETTPYQGMVYNSSGISVDRVQYASGDVFVSAGRYDDAVAISQWIGDTVYLVMNNRPVVPVPPPPYNLSVSGLTQTTADISWQSGGGSSRNFRVAIQAGTNPLDCSNGITTPASNFHFGNLAPETAYSVAICAVNERGALSTPLRGGFRTLEIPPPPAPFNLQVGTITPFTADISWQNAGGTTRAFKVAIQAGVNPSDCASGDQIYGTTYHFPSLSPETTYNVAICAANERGRLSAPLRGTFRTADLPAAPTATGLGVKEWDLQSITLQWRNQGGTTTGFVLNYAEGAVAPACDLSRKIGNVTTYKVSGLKAMTRYSFTVCAVNQLNRLSPAVSVSGTTYPAVPPEPTSLKVVVSGPDSINVSWASGGGTTTSFLLAYQEGAVAPSGCSAGLRLGMVLSKTLTGLKSNTLYSIRLCAANSVLIRSAGLTATVRTLPAIPPEVTSLRVAPVVDHALSLSWASGGGTTTGYQVAYAEGAVAPKSCVGGVKLGMVTSTTLILKPSTLYSVRVCALNSASLSSAGVTGSATTYPAVPPEPTSFKVVVSGPDSISVSWASGGGSTASFLLAYQEGAVAPSGCSAGLRLGMALSKTLTGLKPNTLYSLRLCAANSVLIRSGGLTATVRTAASPASSK